MRSSISSVFCVDGQTLDRTDVDARVAFDAFGRREYGLYVTVQTSLNFTRGLIWMNPSSTSMSQLLKAPREINVRHLLTVGRVVIVVIAPFTDPHLLRDQIRCHRRGDRRAVSPGRGCEWR